MDAKTLKPFNGALDANSGSENSLKPFDGTLDGEEPKRGLKDMAKDAAAWAVKGAIAVPEAAVGLADLATGGQAGKFLENEGGAVGFRPKQAREIVNDWHSDATKRAQQEFQQAEGFGGKLKAAVQNPSNIVGAVAESLPSMLAGGAIGRGLTAATRLGQMGLKGATVAGAAGEGVVGAGSAAEQIRQETEDGLLTPGQTGAALATGAMTGAIGYGAGKVANRLGIGDAETMLAQGQAGLSKQIADQAARNATNPLAATAAKSIPRQMVEGAISEGLLEELPQSISEQILQNLALGKPWTEDVDASAVMGLLSGAAMGSGAAGYRALREPRAKAEDAPASQPAAPGSAEPPKPSAMDTLRQQFEANLASLQEQEQGEPAVPQTAPPDGAAALARQQAAAQAARQAEQAAGRAELNPDDEIYQSTGAAEPQRPSQAMGLDPAAGSLSAAAAVAVDSGAAQAMAPADPGVDQATGEVTPAARLQQVKQRLDFLGQMGRSQGWNNAMVDERNALAAEIKQLQAGQPSAPGDQINQLQAQADGADLTAQDWAQREYRPNSKALPEQAAKGGPADVQEANEQRRLRRMASAQQEAGAAREQAQALMDQANEAAQFASKERQSNDQKAQGAINEGAKTDGSEADQTQQGGAQSPQAGTAPAGPAVPGNRRAPSDAAATAVSGEQGLTHGTAPTEDAGRQAGPAPAPQAQAQDADPAQRLADAGAAWTRMPAAERQALAARLDGVKPVLAKNLPRAQWENLNGDIQRKISDAIAQLDQPTHATQNGTTDQVFNTRKAAIDEGERTGAGYSVEPIAGAGPLGPHRLVIQRKPTDTAAPQARPAAVTEAAHEAATSQHNDLPEPTDAQIEAGNYKKGHVRLSGHDISIENPAGSRRRPEWPPLQNHYGYFKGSVGADKDHVDVFMTDRAHEADLPVFVVDQVNKDGSFDEHKVVMGAADEAEARKTYLGNYEKGWAGLGAITQMTQDQFKAWVRDPAQTKKPAGKLGQDRDSFPLAEANSSYSGISHSGAQRAKMDQEAFVKFMESAQQAGEKLATTAAQREAMARAVEALRADYLTQYRSLMNVRAGTYSGHVAGRGNLNSKQADSRNSALDKAMERFDSWVANNAGRVRKAVLAARTPDQVKADRDALSAQIEAKAAKKLQVLKAQLTKFLDFKNGEEMPYGKNFTVTKVNLDRDGYPSSITFKANDGSPLTSDKLDLVSAFNEPGETKEQTKARLRSVVDSIRAEKAPAAPVPEAPKKQPRGVLAKVAEAQAARADYFTPGNIVKSYGGHDRVIAYTPPDADGRWSVTVRAVQKQGDAWVDVPDAQERVHATQPDARELKAGPVVRAEPAAAPEAAAPAAQGLLERHNAIERAISAGTLALDDYRQTFAALDGDKAAVVAELNKLTKDDLLRSGGAMFAYRYRGEKKDAIVEAAYNTMLDTYALGRQYGSSSFVMSSAGLRAHREAQDKALRELVANTTTDDLAARAAEIKAARDEFKAKREAEAAALANPQTLQDFRGFMRHWVEQGDTSDAAFLRLTPEQRQQFDALEAAQTKEQREAAKRRALVTVQSAGNTTAGEIIATQHTKKGHDLFVVQLAERVSRDDYDTLNASARRLGGSYSSYRGNGAVPGFQFRTREAAEAFQKLVAGDTAQAEQVANARRDAFEDDKSQTAAQRLRTMAEALDERAQESLGMERKANTARRARFAASAEAAARMQQALAGTMRNIAAAIDSGTAQFLDGVRQRVQVEYLMAQLRNARSNQLQAKYPNYGERMKRAGEPIDAETVDFATFPRFEMFRSDLASLARQLQEIDGGKKMGATLARLADDVTDAYTAWAKDNLLRVSNFGNKAGGGFAEFASKDAAERAIKRSGLVGKAIVLPIKRGQNRVILSPGEAMQQGLWQGDGDKRIRLGMEFVEELLKLGKRKGSKALSLPWQLESAYENRQRLQRMGIQTPAEFRSALRELASLQQEMGSPDRIKELERAMVGRANDGLDFFPTSPAVVQSMLDAAEIQEGMAVLEPSAGMGHIADAIVAASGTWPDVVELSPSRRELLEAKGYHLAESNDFLQMEPRKFFTYGDTFRAPDGVEGIMRGVGGMGSQRVRLEDKDGNRLGLYNRDELTGIAQNGSWSGYDRIVMNPPFSDGRDIQHVMHAYSLLRPGGRIVAIMGEGAFFQSNKRAEAFREWLDERGATNEKLPDGSFMDPSLPVNTGAAARMVVIDKPAGDQLQGGDDAPSFRRQESEHLAGADFDVANFLKIMGEGSPAARSAAQLRPDFSPAARAEAVSAVKGTADAIRKAWANGPEVVVAFDMQDPQVPESARRADLKQRSGGAQGAPEGFYYQGKVYLMASKLKTPNDAARVLFHEALGHHGLRGLFGKELGKILNQVATMRKADVDAKIKEYGLRRVNNLDRRTAAEEVLAEMAQNTPEISFVRRAVAAIRTWLRTHVPRFKSLALTDDELIRNFILPARAWVERGAGGGRDGGIAFSRAPAATSNLPDAIIGNTLGAASAHPDYAAAKGGDLKAAVRLAQDLVTPELVAKVKAVIGDTKPLVVPVASEESAGRNKIPRAAAEVLALRLGLDTTFDIVQANRARRTGMDGLDRIFAPVDFDGAVEPGAYLLLDDTLTQGGTFAALASHIQDNGGTVAGVIALTGKQYSAKIQPSPETLASLRQKHGDLETEFRAATGYGFDALTESEARYLARYEPADRLRDRISEEGRRGRAREDQGNPGPDTVDDGPVFSRSRLADIKDSALSQLDTILSHPGKVSLWDKTVGTMRHLAERAPAFKPVYESAQQNIDDVSMLANDAADTAPTLLPRVESLGDLKKKPVSAADNKAVATPLFEGTLVWGRDVGGQPMRVEDLAKKYAGLSVHNKAAMLLKANKIDAGVLAMWQGLPAQQYEKLIDSRFESKFLKAGVVWSDKELQTMFGANAAQIGLYREARAAIDRSIDMTARADMLRVLGDEYRAMRDVVLEQPSLDAAAQLLLDTLEQDAKANPDARDRLGQLEQQVRRRLDMARDLQASGYAPLSRFGRFTLDVVDAKGERQYFGLYETQREANLAKLQMAQVFPGATITQGTMSAEAYKLFAGVTPETLEQFGEMLGLNSTGDEAQDKAFQEYLRLTKNNHSALKRLIHRKGIAGFSEDVGRVVANFVYSNARAGAMGLNAGAMEKAISAIPKEQGELKDLAMGLRDYIRDPQEEGQAVRGMLFAQYLGGSIASAFVNTTQPFAVTLPWLSQYGGMAKAGGQLARALKDMGTKGFKYEPDLAKALQAAEDDGVVSPQEIHQLMAQARGAGMLRAGDGSRLGNARAKASNLWEQGKVLWGQPFALAEQFNRRSTFIAAYRTAEAEGMADPAGFARRAVIETQFQYSKANKPQWARGAIGGTLFTFKTYSVSYLELMHRMWNQGGPEGKRAVGWAVAMLLLMGGAGGLPFMEDAEDLIDGAAQLMGYNVSAKQWRKQLLADVVGKEVADFMEQGVSGLPGAPVDVSGRLGMGNLIPGTGLFLSKQGRERDLLEIAGPAGDFVSRGFTAARKVLTGDVGGAALEVSPTAVRNLAKGADMAATGMYRDQKGYKVLDTTLAEAAAKAIGFQPKSVAEVQEANSFMQRSKSFYIQQSSEIKAQWADALFRKDEAAVQRVRERLAAWNRDNPEQPIVVKMPDIWKRVREMGKDRTQRIADTAPKALRQQMRDMARDTLG